MQALLRPLPDGAEEADQRQPQGAGARDGDAPATVRESRRRRTHRRTWEVGGLALRTRRAAEKIPLVLVVS